MPPSSQIDTTSLPSRRGRPVRRLPGGITAAQSGSILTVWLAMWMLTGNSPLGTRWTPAVIPLTIVFCLAARNLYLIAAALACINLGFRWNLQVSHWHDMAWGQWYSISSLIAGHDLYAPAPQVGMSLANYLPLGNLYGGVLIGIGIHRYWDVWHLLVVVMLLLPFLLRPGVASLILFIFTATFYPFSDYTSGSGSLEISYAITLAAIALYRANRVDTSLVFFAYVALMRQPSVMLVPFVGLLLWKNRDYRRLTFFAILLLLFGGLYILFDPKDAYEALYGVWAPYAQQWFNAYTGLGGNYSLSSVFALFGVDVRTAWYAWSGFYLPITLAAIALLFVAAWRSAKRDTVLALGVFATVFVYVFSRGYAQFHYLLGTTMPLAAFLSPPARRRLPIGQWTATALAYILIWLAVTPLAIFGLGKAAALYAGFHSPDPEVPVAATYALSGATRTSVPNLDGTPAHARAFQLNQAIDFELARPASVSEVILIGEQVPVQSVRGISMLYATENEMRGALTEGDIEASTDGRAFSEVLHFHTSESYSVYPVHFRVRTASPVRFIRVLPREAFADHREWVFGRVAILGR